MSNLISGARMLLECLRREGVDCIFSLEPGGRSGNQPLFEGLPAVGTTESTSSGENQQTEAANFSGGERRHDLQSNVGLLN